MAQILKHSLSEIKPQKTKLFNPVSTMQRLNRALAEAIGYDGDDACMANYLVNYYLQSLDLYHVNGRAGSLLPKEEEAIPAQAGTTDAQVIAAANAAYDNVYAPRIPYMLAGTIADAAAAHQAFRAALVGAN
jgi:glutathione S-transferase